MLYYAILFSALVALAMSQWYTPYESRRRYEESGTLDTGIITAVWSINEVTDHAISCRHDNGSVTCLGWVGPYNKGYP